MDDNKKRIVRVTLEEHLSRDFDVEIPDNISDDRAEEYAENKVINDYQKMYIILDADDFNGVRLVQTEFNGVSTEWHECIPYSMEMDEISIDDDGHPIEDIEFTSRIYDNPKIDTIAKECIEAYNIIMNSMKSDPKQHKFFKYSDAAEEILKESNDENNKETKIPPICE